MSVYINRGGFLWKTELTLSASASSSFSFACEYYISMAYFRLSKTGSLTFSAYMLLELIYLNVQIGTTYSLGRGELGLVYSGQSLENPNL